MSYGALPAVVRYDLDISTDEMMFYQYLPIKLAGSHEIRVESRLSWLTALVGAVNCDYIGLRGLDDFIKSYVYVSAKRLYQQPGCPFNRPGWHSDGFMTDDINYIWFDSCPTVFNFTPFKLTQDDALSLAEMDQQVNESLNVTYEPRSLLRLDQFVIHKVSDAPEAMMRTFVKVSISKDKYDLKGNAHNSLLDYRWPMRERSIARNIPQNSHSVSTD